MTQEEKRRDLTFPVLYVAFVFIVWFLLRLRLKEKIKKSGLTKAEYMKKYHPPKRRCHYGGSSGE